jgi:hypothetical protein
MIRFSDIMEGVALLLTGGVVICIFAALIYALLSEPKPSCESAHITIAASELCSAEQSCSLTIHDVEKYLKARRVHGECLREGAYD